MLKSGLFITPERTYTVYEIEERNFYRIDFCRQNAAFQVEPDAVFYSQVKRKNAKFKGDADIYYSYLRIKETIESAKMDFTKDAGWNEGVYATTTRGVNTKLGYTSECILENGVMTSYTLTDGKYTIMSSVIDPLYGVALDPMDFQRYNEVSISKDTVVSDDGSLFYSIDVLKRRFDIRHIDEKDYVVATDLETARERLNKFLNDPYPLRGFDTETTGTDVDMYGDDHMVGIILGSNPNSATYFPFRHKEDINLPMSFLAELMEAVIKLQDRCVAHNKKFDRKVMLKEGYDTRIKWDTMLISIILNPILGKGIHGLKYLIQELNGKRFLELDDIFINSKDIDFSVLPLEIIKYYACPDGTNVLDLIEDQFKKLPQYQNKLAILECALADVKADMEYYGIRVDTKKFEKQYRNCNYVLDVLLKAFRTLTHEDGNINSSQVLTDLIYNKMHCKVLLRTKTGQASTSAAAVNKLAKIKAKEPHNITEDLVDLNGKVIIKAKDLANSAYPALVILAKYREYNKLKTAFYSRFERTMKTGRIFFWVNQNGAATGRQSSPMHQLPPELKDVILSDSDDCDFWGPDFSQIELRMIAYLAGEKELIELAKDPDNDIHRIIGSLISNKPMWAITPEERSTGKRRNFGVVYLISAMGLAQQIFGPGASTENIEFCQQQLDAFYHKFKRIDRYIKNNAALVQKRGYMETAWYHRVRDFKEIFDPNIEPSRKASILRMANNVPVQGTSADYLKLAEVQMYDYIRSKGWNELKDGFPKVRMMLSIHDEIIISADNSIPYEEIIEMITVCMETPVDDAPPFFVQPARMDNWGGHSDDACAMPIKYRDKVIEDYHNTGLSVFKQSYFKLSMSPEVKGTIDIFTGTPDEAVEKYLKDVTLVFDHGDYVKEFTEDDVKTALKAYVYSNKTTYRIDNYIKLLDDFRSSKLKDYMHELIAEYGMDYKAVGEHVRHPSLTHALLDNYSKYISKDLSHEERITEAARLYIEDLKGSGQRIEAAPKTEVRKVSDKDTFIDNLEPLVNFDSEGNVVFEDVSDEFEDVYNSYYDPAPDDIITYVNREKVYVWELGDIITVDCYELTPDSVDRVLSYSFEHSCPDGFYSLKLIYKGELLDTKLRIENIDIQEFNSIVTQLANNPIYNKAD